MSLSAYDFNKIIQEQIFSSFRVPMGATYTRPAASLRDAVVRSIDGIKGTYLLTRKGKVFLYGRNGSLKEVDRSADGRAVLGLKNFGRATDNSASVI